MKESLFLVLILFLTGTLFSEISKFKSDDKVVFIGDNGAADGVYQECLQRFYTTRFPREKVDMRNCGLWGNNIWLVSKRMHWDVLSLKPTVAVLVIGPNTILRDVPLLKEDSEKAEIERANALKGYSSGVFGVVKLLTDNKVYPVLILPESLEKTTGTAESRGMSITVQKTGILLQKLAERFNGSYFDLDKTMLDFGEKQQNIGSATVLSAKTSYGLMAYLFLKEQGLASELSRIKIEVQTGRGDSEKGTVSDLKINSEGCSFRFAAQALPYPYESTEAEAVKIFDFDSRFNSEILQVKGLSGGRYTLLIDGEKILEASADEFAKGIQLSSGYKTPQYKQAENVMKLLSQRSQIEKDVFRSVAFVRQNYSADGWDQNKTVDEIRKRLEGKKALNWNEQFEKKFLDSVSHLEEKSLKMQELLDAAYQAAIPLERKYEISRLTGAEK